MKRREDNIAVRPESTSGPLNVGGTHALNPAFMRLPATTTGTPARVTQPIALSAPTPVSIPANLPLIMEEQPVRANYVPNRIEMHPAVHGISAFTSAVSSGTSSNTCVNPVTAEINRSEIGSPSSATIVTKNEAAIAPSGNIASPSSTITNRPRQISGPTTIHQATSAQVGNAATVAALNSQISGQFQRLKVEDALSYLDQVKLRFGRQPQVYNDFLDIMKEFKSQSIDTPGVIQRVSTLFRGNPELIVGFNTFLPPGYKIEVQGNEQVSVSVPGQQHATVVHTPQGTQHHIVPAAVPSSPSVPAATTQLKPTTGPSRTPQPPHSFNIQTANPALSPSLPVTSTNTPATVSTSVATPTTVPVSTPTPPLQLLTQSSQLSAVASTLHGAQHQQSPVEFNHAINYVNKIKSRFLDQPDTYKQFLDILHTYQKEQKCIKEGVTVPRSLTDAEVYERVAKLFKNENDLLEEFGQFLPDATNNTAQAAVSDIMDQYKSLHSAKSVITSEIKKPIKSSNVSSAPQLSASSSSQTNLNTYGKKPRPSDSFLPPAKRSKPHIRDGSFAEAGKHATLTEYNFFDKVRKALRNETTYHNFIKCIYIFTQGALSKADLIALVNPILQKVPDLQKWFTDFVGVDDIHIPPIDSNLTLPKQERVNADLAMEIDYNTCKRLGASYCALPKSFPVAQCSGKTPLCKEVLNDVWVSFPSWSEDSTFVTSKKTQFEEYMYRCEDERFELDMVMETNNATVKVLQSVKKQMEKMTAKELSNFTLNDSLNGTCMTVYRMAIGRVYGDKASDIINGLKKNPQVAVPVVLRRLLAKDADWRDAQKGFNKSWREVHDRYHVKSLDHCGLTFKQSDTKTIRSKSLLNEIEVLYDERHEKMEAGYSVETGPHMSMVYKDRSVLDDAANLIIHHVRRQTVIHKDDKAKIKQIVRQFVPDLFFHSRMELSDDERDLDDEDVPMDEDSDASTKEKKDKKEENGNNSNGSSHSGSCKRKTRSTKIVQKSSDDGNNGQNSVEREIKKEPSPSVNGDAMEIDKPLKTEIKTELTDSHSPLASSPSIYSDDQYKLFMCNNSWYLLLRLHQILCSRLSEMYDCSLKIAAQDERDKTERKESAALALRLRQEPELNAEMIYPHLLDMVKSVLDGNMDSTAFEDKLREIFGVEAYKAFTLDKVVNGSVRQLQHIVCDHIPSQCTSIFLQETKKGAAGGPKASVHRRQYLEQQYQKRIEKLLHMENCYKLLTHKRDGLLTIELVDAETEESEENGSVSNGQCKEEHSIEPHKWNDYIDKYMSMSPQLNNNMLLKLSKKPVFLPRNLRSWMTKSDNNSKRIDVQDNTQCKFNISNFKMIFVVNSDSCIYKRKAFYRARISHEGVSKRMKASFSKWHNSWCKSNVNGEHQNNTLSWFNGKSDDLKPNNTVLKRIQLLDKPPYEPYNKFVSS